MSQLGNVVDLLGALPPLVNRFGHVIWWRGQSRDIEDWKLRPSVYREDRGRHYEQQVAMHFKRQAPSRHQPCPANEDFSSWLYLAQHYRLPTRLLDWSESPLVALFFAVSANMDQSGALWALAPWGLNRRQLNIETVLSSRDPAAKAQFTSVFDEVTPAPPAVCMAIYPEHVDARTAAQLSAFTIHGVATPIEELPGAADFAVKFTISPAAKRVFGASLDLLGIRISNLFPDLEHLAEDVSSLRFGPG